MYISYVFMSHVVVVVVVVVVVDDDDIAVATKRVLVVIATVRGQVHANHRLRPTEATIRKRAAHYYLL